MADNPWLQPSDNSLLLAETGAPVHEPAPKRGAAVADVGRAETDLARREAAVAARERDVEQRLASLQAREQELFNWPGFCGLKFVRHNIKARGAARATRCAFESPFGSDFLRRRAQDDVPVEHRALVRTSYVTFLVLTLALFYNVLEAVLMWGNSFTPGFTLLQIVYFIVRVAKPSILSRC